jgi:hypothetical protein
MEKQWLRRGMALVIVLALCLPPLALMADSREDSAQELASMAEKLLAQGEKEEAIRLANIVFSEFSDTRAARKAEEIKRLAEAESEEEAPTTPATPAPEQAPTTSVNEWPDPKVAFRRGCYYPGGGQFYLKQGLGGCACLSNSVIMAMAAICFFARAINPPEYGCVSGEEGRPYALLLSSIYTGTLGGLWVGGAIGARKKAENLRYTMYGEVPQYPPQKGCAK